MFQEDDAPTALASLVIGGIVGASLALILMPRSVSETRRPLAGRAGSLWRHGRSVVDDLATRAARERVPEPGLSSTSPTIASQA